MALSAEMSRTLDVSRARIADSLKSIRQSAANIADTMQADVLHNTKILRTVATMLEDGLVLLDQDSRITIFNPAAATIFGVDPDTVVGKTFDQLFPALAQRLRDGDGTIRDLQSTDDDGNESALSIAFATMTDPAEGTPFKVLVARKGDRKDYEEDDFTAEQRLEELRELYGATVWNFPLPTFFTDPNGNMIRGSKEFHSLMGRSPSQLTGRNIDEVLPASYLSWYYGEEKKSTKVFHLSTPRGVKEFMAHRSTVHSPDQRLLGYVTALVKQQQNTPTPEEGYVSNFIKTIDALDRPIMLLSYSEGRILLVNRAFCNKYGYDRGEITNSGAKTLLVDGSQDKLRRKFAVGLAKGQEVSGLLKVKDAAGNHLLLRVKAISITTEGNRSNRPKYCLLTEF